MTLFMLTQTPLRLSAVNASLFAFNWRSSSSFYTLHPIVFAEDCLAWNLFWVPVSFFSFSF